MALVDPNGVAALQRVGGGLDLLPLVLGRRIKVLCEIDFFAVIAGVFPDRTIGRTQPIPGMQQRLAIAGQVVPGLTFIGGVAGGALVRSRIERLLVDTGLLEVFPEERRQFIETRRARAQLEAAIGGGDRRVARPGQHIGIDAVEGERQADRDRQAAATTRKRGCNRRRAGDRVDRIAGLSDDRGAGRADLGCGELRGRDDQRLGGGVDPVLGINAGRTDGRRALGTSCNRRCTGEHGRFDAGTRHCPQPQVASCFDIGAIEPGTGARNRWRIADQLPERLIRVVLGVQQDALGVLEVLTDVLVDLAPQQLRVDQDALALRKFGEQRLVLDPLIVRRTQHAGERNRLSRLSDDVARHGQAQRQGLDRLAADTHGSRNRPQIGVDLGAILSADRHITERIACVLAVSFGDQHHLTRVGVRVATDAVEGERAAARDRRTALGAGCDRHCGGGAVGGDLGVAPGADTDLAARRGDDRTLGMPGTVGCGDEGLDATVDVVPRQRQAHRNRLGVTGRARSHADRARRHFGIDRRARDRLDHDVAARRRFLGLLNRRLGVGGDAVHRDHRGHADGLGARGGRAALGSVGRRSRTRIDLERKRGIFDNRLDRSVPLRTDLDAARDVEGTVVGPGPGRRPPLIAEGGAEHAVGDVGEQVLREIADGVKSQDHTDRGRRLHLARRARDDGGVVARAHLERAVAGPVFLVCGGLFVLDRRRVVVIGRFVDLGLLEERLGLGVVFSRIRFVGHLLANRGVGVDVVVRIGVLFARIVDRLTRQLIARSAVARVILLLGPFPGLILAFFLDLGAHRAVVDPGERIAQHRVGRDHHVRAGAAHLDRALVLRDDRRGLLGHDRHIASGRDREPLEEGLDVAAHIVAHHEATDAGAFTGAAAQRIGARCRIFDDGVEIECEPAAGVGIVLLRKVDWLAVRGALEDIDERGVACDLLPERIVGEILLLETDVLDRLLADEFVKGSRFGAAGARLHQHPLAVLQLLGAIELGVGVSADAHPIAEFQFLDPGAVTVGEAKKVDDCTGRQRQFALLAGGR